MRATISNDSIVLENPDKKVYSYFEKLCQYKDKAASYSLNRLSKSYYLRNASYIGTPQRQKVINQISELKTKVYGNIMVKQRESYYILPSGFASHLHQFKELEIIDNRKETGSRVSYPWVKKPHDLRDYQAEAVSAIESNFRGMINLSTGAGKTLIAIHAIRLIKKKTLILCPSDFIASQTEALLISAFGESKVCFYGDGIKKTDKAIIVGIVNSVNNDIEKFKELDLGLIIIDEAHKTAADTVYNIAGSLSNVGKIFGLTATNYRNDGKDVLLEASCGNTLIEKDTIWCIENNWLTPPVFLMKTIPGVADHKDNKDKNYKANVLYNDKANTIFISDIQADLANGRKVLCLVDQVEHGRILSAATGLPFVTGADKNSDRFIKDFNKGLIQGLIATDSKVGEGSDLPAIDSLIMANFTASKVAVIQCLGRGLRLYPGKKECLVRDYTVIGCNMFERHSLMRIGYYKEITDSIILVR